MSLIDVSSGTVEAIAASPRGPIQLVVEAQFDRAAHPFCCRHRRLDRHQRQRRAEERIVLDNVDPEAPPGTRTELDPTKLDADAARVFAHLLAQGLSQATGGDPVVGRVARNLPQACSASTRSFPRCDPRSLQRSNGAQNVGWRQSPAI